MFSARGGSFYSPTLSPELQYEPFGAQEALQLLEGCGGAAQKLFYSQHRQAQEGLTKPRSEVNCSCHSGQVEISPAKGKS